MKLPNLEKEQSIPKSQKPNQKKNLNPHAPVNFMFYKYQIANLRKLCELWI